MKKQSGYKIKRLIAYAIDWYLYSIVLIAFNAIFSKVCGVEATVFMTLELYSLPAAFMCFALMLLLHFVYFILIPFYFNGQSIGKKITKLKIVSINGEKVTIKQLVIREFIGVILVEGYLSVTNGYLRTLLGMFFSQTKILSIGWFIISGLSSSCALYSKEARMFHDYIGTTKVINI
ncbi:MAG: RDD family protein [Erysipelotrichaceae bacterium]